MKYSIKISGCGRYNGEYEGADTLRDVRALAAGFLPECENGKVSIVKFMFGPGLPEDGLVETVEVFYDGRDR